jgi:2-methylisocitrate lyase-like PEP mutase family enzyme
MQDFDARRQTFRQLHDAGCFVIPNPWDVGTARALHEIGFAALATTSAGYAFSRGKPDLPGELAVDNVLAHIADIVLATDLPVSADFQSGYATDLDTLATNVRRCVATGVAGLSIEDSTGRSDQPLYDLAQAVERVRVARAAIDASGADVLLTARAECFLVHQPDALGESIRRLQAYADAGADVLFAPGVNDPEGIKELARSVLPKPLNVLVSGNNGLSVAQLAELGARRPAPGASAQRWPEPLGELCSVPPGRLPRTAVSLAWTTPSPLPSSTPCSGWGDQVTDVESGRPE